MRRARTLGEGIGVGVADAVGQPDDAAEGRLRRRLGERRRRDRRGRRPRARLQRVEALADSPESAAASDWLAASAVASSAIGRPASSASVTMRWAVSMVVGQFGAAAQPLSTTISSGPLPGATSAVGLNTGPASARMTTAASARRSAVSHQGLRRGLLVLAGDVEQQPGRRESVPAAASAASGAGSTRSPAGPTSAASMPIW